MNVESVTKITIDYERIYERKERFCMLQIPLAAKMPDAATRQAIGVSRVKLHDPSSRYVIGCSIVVHNAVVRAFMTGANWMLRSPYPEHLAASLPAAGSWLSERFMTEGVPIRSSLAKYLDLIGRDALPKYQFDASER